MVTAYDRLCAETEEARAEFLSIPVLAQALAGKVPRQLYGDFLNQAYHHVRHTCPLLSLAASRTGDTTYRNALYAYLKEEEGHDEWILADIAVISGRDAPLDPPRPPCRVMVGYAYYAIDWISPYALLGMVHVLEGMSTLLATRAANALQKAFRTRDGKGFSYLASHGALDIEHTGFFEDLLDRLEDPSAIDVVIDCAQMMYGLYGNIFRDLQTRLETDAAVAQG